MAKSKAAAKKPVVKKNSAAKPIESKKNVAAAAHQPGNTFPEDSQAWERGLSIPCEKP